MTERKIHCFDCHRLIGKLDLTKGALRMLPGSEWEITGTCPECLDNGKHTPDSQVDIEDLFKSFGIIK